jgi:ABC-type Mn2+/Zn2+ transport system ATPase subunit
MAYLANSALTMLSAGLMLATPMDLPSSHDKHAPPIHAEQLRAAYNGDLALEDLTFTVGTGQRLAIVGPNGAGKTTLFKVLAGILRPTGGSLEIFGHGPGRHVCVGYLPQRSQVNLDFPATVAEVVMMGRIREIGLFRWPRKSDWEKVDSALNRVGLTRHRARPIGALSAGQQQRVFLAQAVAQQADIVLLDEPMSGLDMPAQEALFEILDELSQMSVTVLIATHDLNLAAERFDQVMLLNRRLIALGDPTTAITSEALMEAYGGHLHVVADGTVVIDTHHEGLE